MADIHRPSLSELKNQKRVSIYIPHLEKIANALDISDISKFIEIIDTDEE
ncbi:helix-turn-helix domain-containing protein [Bacillus sp. BRMEA1]|nr:helix-turn-helix domain-containing protein [Neobacillus endophyticus]NRD76935.1 helix-turn-helix domain-containing protein [Neobacillus endophyticus]